MVPQLVDAGARVTVVDNLDNGYMENLASVESEVDFIEGDLRDARLSEAVTKQKDVVLNLAAKAFGMEYSRHHNGEMLVYNLLSTLTPLEAARINGVPRYLIVSSSCVYPDDAAVPTPELETFTGKPESVNEGYGWAKRIQELAGTYYSHDYGMRVSIVRPFNPYGGHYHWTGMDKAHVVPALVKRILDGEDPLVVWGSGKQRRNLLHASDAVHLILKVVENNTGPIPVNIGYSDDVAVSDLVDQICELADKRPTVKFDMTKPEGRFRKCSEPTRMLAVTNAYEPRVGLRDGILDMFSWYQRSFAKLPRPETV
jgi:nucleoside-diphosphate-sugar epimerase